MQVAGQDYPILLTYDLKIIRRKMKKFLAIFSLFVGLVFLTACSTSSSSTDVELSSMPKIEGITYHGDIPKILKSCQLCLLLHRLSLTIRN